VNAVAAEQYRPWPHTYSARSNEARTRQVAALWASLIPVEHLWDELREKHFRNLAFDSIVALEDHLESALRTLETTRESVHSIV